MVIGRLTDGSLVLGLSSENVKRLREGKPIRITKESHPNAPLDGVPRILILYGDTERAIVEELSAAERGVQ
jgi:hypothetical protein